MCSFTGVFIASLVYFNSKVGETSQETTKQILQARELKNYRERIELIQNTMNKNLVTISMKFAI